MAALSELPAVAAWQHLDARDGFEVLFAHSDAGGHRFEGSATGVEDRVAWSVRYAVRVDAAWATREAHVVSRSLAGERAIRLEADGSGGWRVDGRPAPELHGLLDVDLEASAFTNALPVRRLALSVGEEATAPTAYVRVPDLDVERLEQRYTRLPDDGDRVRYDYESPRFGFRAILVYDAAGLVLEYPKLARRAL